LRRANAMVVVIGVSFSSRITSEHTTDLRNAP